MVVLHLQSMELGKGSFWAFDLKNLAKLEVYKWAAGIRQQEEDEKTVPVSWQD